MEERKGFGSNFGFLMAAIGSAVGLGNIWGFPNKMGANGGFTFLIIYLILAACCGFIVMMGELALGRKTGRGAIGAYRVLSKRFKWLGWLGVLSAFLILGFYCALGGYCLKYVTLNVGNLFHAGFGTGTLDGAGVFGALMALLPMMKGLPLAYNKDMQEDKEAVFDAVDTLRLCLTPFIPMLKTMRVLKENMRAAAAKGFINATDCADYLVASKGLPFRDAYKITGELVALCIERGLTLETLPIDEYKKVCNAFDEGVYEAINLEKCVRDRKVKGAPCPENVRAAAKEVRTIVNGL